MSARSEDTTWALDREIVLSRVFDAPRELVFKVWTDAEHLAMWYGPKGFSIKTHAMETRVGGRWKFDMIGPDGTVWDSRMEFVEIVPNERIVFDYGSDIDNDPARFRCTITFDEQADKKTIVTMRQLHPTKTQRDAGVGFGAVEMGYQTLEKFAEYLRTRL